MCPNNNIKDKFDLLYATLCETQNGLLDSTAKVAGLLLLVTGWIVTSESAQKFIKANEFFKYLALIILLIAFALYVWASLCAFWISQSTISLLNDLNYMESKYYEQRQVEKRTLILFIGGNFLIVALSIFLILWQ